MQTTTAVALPRDIDADLDAWLKPFLDATGRKSRRNMAPLYVRGLLGDGGRKSIPPMAERLGLPGHDQLHHFISSSAWRWCTNHGRWLRRSLGRDYRISFPIVWMIDALQGQ